MVRRLFFFFGGESFLVCGWVFVVFIHETHTKNDEFFFVVLYKKKQKNTHAHRPRHMHTHTHEHMHTFALFHTNPHRPFQFLSFLSLSHARTHSNLWTIPCVTGTAILTWRSTRPRTAWLKARSSNKRLQLLPRRPPSPLCPARSQSKTQNYHVIQMISYVYTYDM